MTINGLSSYSASLAAVAKKTASDGFSQLTNVFQQGTQASESSKTQRPPKPNEAALTKLQETDPALAQKMEEFHQKIDQMKQDGASEEDVRSAMKTNMDSLSDTEKSELKSIFGNPPPKGPGGPPPVGPPPIDSQDLISKLKDSNPDLATKLESLKETSTEDSESKWKELLSSLSDTEKSDLKQAMDETRPQRLTESNNESQAKSLVQQALSAYLKSANNWSSQMGQTALAA